MTGIRLVPRVLLGNTLPMKCAISLPDDVFSRVEAEAEKLGISRSQFFADAARRYLEELSRQHVTEQINAFVEKHGDVTTDPDVSWVLEAGRRHVASPD